ncbi:MAG: phosphate-starvation-inducible protein PsiE [Lysinibacillus sp.]
MAKKPKVGKITESRLQEAMAIRNEVFIELIAQVLHEKLVIERPILHERMENLVELANYDEELTETLYALIKKL